MATSSSSPPRPRFRLEFRVVSDGQDTARAQALTRAGHHAHGSAFSFFPLLPPELRLKIWEYLLAPRIVAVACIDDNSPFPTSFSESGDGNGNGQEDEDEEDEPPYPWPSFPHLQDPPAPTAVPPLLLVSREARRLALARYTPAFGWKVPYVLVSNSPSHSSSPASSSLFSPSQQQQQQAGGHSTSFSTSTSSSSSSGSAASASWSWSRPRVWFDYARDALYLVGELEPCDTYGFNSPMAYFLRREETRRVRRLAVAFGALRYGEAGSQHIFGALFHVVDRFSRLQGGKVLVAVVPRDEFTHLLVGGEGPLVRPERNGAVGVGAGAGAGEQRRGGQEEEENVVQRIWRDWYRGTSALANTQFELVREIDLPEHVAKPVRSITNEA
ncbi:uncharacterized protein F4812DRAFT_413870 [Daldinia caldariorum]|uniref:uncharacterized protein n=1 Tax=Daldinia caldariorum TaxID=326644 RepID=UPI002008DF10|nr:uncharacterized protein F4812DRAFT_413870 [Daldinia caldariorum]KAI1471390.1 hypothetical protein F4812DRAFT_413870 [Daldinia caldariorum]